jgi:hypothetical protein
VLEEEQKKKDYSLFILIGLGVLTVILWNIPYGPYVLYPFSILGTWFHEMGHGLTCLILGGNFDHLKMYQNGSGVAINYTQDLWISQRIGKAAIALGGLLGPPIAGSLFILSTKSTKATSFVLWCLSVFMVLSVVIWVRTLFGILILCGIAVVIIGVAWKFNAPWKKFILQFLGIQAVFSTYRQLDYLFTEKATIGGKEMLSDTGLVAQQLWLPYWFWAILVILLSILMIRKSFLIILNHNQE